MLIRYWWPRHMVQILAMVVAVIVGPPARGESILSGDLIQVQTLLQGPLPPPSATSQTPSQAGITLPSLWWIDQQFGEKLVIEWLAYDNPNPNQQQVRLFVRPNLWTRFSYLERYSLVTHFGSLTRTYGYQMLLLDNQGNPLASYLCDFDTQKPQVIAGAQTFQKEWVQSYAGPTQPNLPCNLWMNTSFPRGNL